MAVGKNFETMLRFLFPYTAYTTKLSSMILLQRLLFGGLMMWHGISKIVDFPALVDSYPDPIGLGSRATLYLAIFTEVFCAAGVVLGAFYRLALIPLIISMCVAFLIVHHGDGFAAKELALIFFVMFVEMFVLGAGRYSLDDMIAALVHRNATLPDTSATSSNASVSPSNVSATSSNAPAASSASVKEPMSEALTTRQQDSVPRSGDAPRR